MQKSPLILFGENCLNWNLNLFTLLTKINKNINFSVLNHNVAASGLERMVSIWILKNESNSKKVFLLILVISLTEEEIKKKEGFWVYIGSHGHDNLRHLWSYFTVYNLFRKRIYLYEFNRFNSKIRFFSFIITTN